MRVSLFDFQEDALAELRAKLAMARQHASVRNAQAISFSAPTGSGKTIILTALFEGILFGDSGWGPQHDAVILWVSDMPSLNEQSRLKIEGKSDRIRARQLISIEGASFEDTERLEGGRIYFVNTQKLGDDKLLTTPGNRRQHTIWKAIANTAQAIPDRFYVVIDEAHRGMRYGKGAEKATTIMQRFLKGSEEHGIVRMPLVVGVSATPQRFEQLLAGTTYTVHRVYVPIDDVRKSGLLKDRIVIRFPENGGEAEMSLVKEAAILWREMAERWRAYCSAESERAVSPILVIQVEDSSGRSLTRTRLDLVLSTIESAIGRKLGDGEVAHTVNESGDQRIGPHLVRRIEPSRIEDDDRVGVVLFKMNLSTGWDCPRAEVMMSFRAARDHTYIAQLLGRMVRTPLARRIHVDAKLNDVHLLLPHFNSQAVNNVVEDLRDIEEVPPAEIGTSAELTTLSRRVGTEHIFKAMNDLVTYRVGAVRRQSALRRLIGLARAVSHDAIHEDALEVVRSMLIAKMGQAVKEMASGNGYEANIARIKGTALRTVVVPAPSGIALEPVAQYVVETEGADIDERFDEAGRSFGNGLHMAYWQAHSGRGGIDPKAEMILLALEPERMRELEAFAETKFDELYETYRRNIDGLIEARRRHYERLRLAAAMPKDIRWELPTAVDHKRTASAQAFPKHLFVDSDERFLCDLGNWEKGVLEEELRRHEMVGWLRNPVRKPWSLEIPYVDGPDTKPMFPDLLIVRTDSAGVVFDILEPHDPSLRDNFAKARGLAIFAERHGQLFGRIEMIRGHRTAGREVLTRLDVNRLDVRRKVMRITDNNGLDDLFQRA